MDVRNIFKVNPILTCKGTCKTWMLSKNNEYNEKTRGGYLAYIDEFQTIPPKELAEHAHYSFEWYYVLNGRGLMKIENDKREVYPGDLIEIPPLAIHSIKSLSDSFPCHCLCFAIALDDNGEFFEGPNIKEEIKQKKKSLRENRIKIK